jgi:hypothetical protein
MASQVVKHWHLESGTAKMLTYKELQEKGICWTGYKRKKGTKPYEQDSCVKEEKDAGGHGSEKHHVLAFGRMNPITSGHEAVVNKLHSVAKEHGASHSLVVSHSQDAKKNPLTGEQKVAHAKNAFPGTKVSSASKEAPTILHHAAAAHAAGATHLHVIAGSDRHEEMHNLLHKYNGKDSGHGHYNFKKITVHSSGERDPDAEGTTGISASKMREHAASGNKAEFHKGAPSKMKPEHKDAMYNDVRKGMNIKEELRSDMGAAAYINDFIKSTNPRFNNKSKEERRKMAIGAFMAAKEKIKEGTLQGNIGGGDAMNTTTSAPSASTSKDTTMNKKIKGFKFFNGENDRQMNMNQPVKEDIDQVEEGYYEKPASAYRRKGDEIGGGSSKNDVPFDGPYKSNFKKPNNPNRTGMDAARSLAQRAMDQLNTKKKEDIKEGERGLWDNIHAKRKRIENGSGERMRKPGSKGAPTADALKAAAESFEHNFDMLEEAVKSIDTGEYDYEGQMARTQLQTICRNSTDLIAMLNDEDNMPEWVQSKITLAQDYISTVRDYLQSKEELGEETLDEKSDQARRNKTMKNMMDASRGARYKLNNPVPDTDHKTPQAKNKAIGRALRNEELDESIFDNKDHAQSIADKLKKKTDDGNYSVVADHGKHRIVHAYNSDSKVKKDIARLNEMKTGNPGFGYHGQHQSTNDADEAYKKIHAHVKSLTDSDDKTVKHYLDSAHGRHLVGHENDHDHIKKDFKKFAKYYKPEMHEATAQKGVNVDKVNHAGDEPHEEKWEPAPKNVSKLKKVKEENMKSYKEFLQSLDEKLIGKQHKIDKNKNGKVDAHDFELLRKEEADHLLEYTPGPDGKTIIKGRSYGADYVDPEGADETAADMKKKEKKPAGRKTGQSTGSYKPRATMSKLKSAGSTYK